MKTVKIEIDQYESKNATAVKTVLPDSGKIEIEIYTPIDFDAAYATNGVVFDETGDVVTGTPREITINWGSGAFSIKDAVAFHSAFGAAIEEAKEQAFNNFYEVTEAKHARNLALLSSDTSV